MDEDLRAIVGCIEFVIDYEVDGTGPAASAILPAGEIHKYESHEVRCNTEEVGTALEVLSMLLNEFGVGLVEQCGGLKGVAGAFVAEGAAG